MTDTDPYADYPEVLKRARGEFKVLDGVETARLGEEWVVDAPGATVRAVAVYVRDDADGGESGVRALADELGLYEHEPARDEDHPRMTKVAFIPPDEMSAAEAMEVAGSPYTPSDPRDDR